MKTFEYEIQEMVGIHARPAGMLVKAASAYKSTVFIERDGSSADAKKIIALMALGVKHKEKVIFKIEGIDEEKAAEELSCFCRDNL